MILEDRINAWQKRLTEYPAIGEKLATGMIKASGLIAKRGRLYGAFTTCGIKQQKTGIGYKSYKSTIGWISLHLGEGAA